MLGCRLPMIPGMTPAPRYADDWFTSEDSSVDIKFVSTFCPCPVTLR